MIGGGGRGGMGRKKDCLKICQTQLVVYIKGLVMCVCFCIVQSVTLCVDVVK